MSNVTDAFHNLYYNSRVWGNGNTKWLGYTILKYPSDLILYQEIIYELKPDVIIETGTWNGGSALFLASILDFINKGKVISIDIAPKAELPTHSRITFLKSSSTSLDVFQQVKNIIQPNDVVLVILDSDHSKEHVLSEMRLYETLVTKGSYLIVEDTNINGNPVLSDFGPGPMEAVDEFLLESNSFIIDHSKHKFFVTFNPRGYLKKIK